MKYTVAVVAASLASGAVAGVVHGHAGAHQHRAREAEAAAEAEPITYSDGQCWGTWGCNAKTGAPAAASSAPASATVVQAAAQTTAASAANVVQNAVSKATSAAGSIASGVTSSGGSVNVANLLTSIKGDSKILAAVASDLVAEGSGMSNQFDITNNAGEDIVYVCWGSAGSWVNSQAPLLAMGIPKGSMKTVSFADTPGGQQGPACSVVSSHSTMVNGQIKNTWVEHTFNSFGTVDVSREPSVTGNSISIKTPQGCTSDMDSCVYKCVNTDGSPAPNGQSKSPGQCMDKGYYKLQNCSGTGTNPSSDYSNGGCQFGSGAGKMSMTIGPFVGSW